MTVEGKGSNRQYPEESYGFETDLFRLHNGSRFRSGFTLSRRGTDSSTKQLRALEAENN